MKTREKHHENGSFKMGLPRSREVEERNRGSEEGPSLMVWKAINSPQVPAEYRVPGRSAVQDIPLDPVKICALGLQMQLDGPWRYGFPALLTAIECRSTQRDPFPPLFDYHSIVSRLECQAAFVIYIYIFFFGVKTVTFSPAKSMKLCWIFTPKVRKF